MDTVNTRPGERESVRQRGGDDVDLIQYTGNIILNFDGATHVKLIECEHNRVSMIER